MDFIKTVIEGREYGKFAFTRNLSKAIQMIKDIGEKEGISKEDCAYINARVVKELYVSTKDVKTVLRCRPLFPGSRMSWDFIIPIPSQILLPRGR